ncbi:hypothetical protein [Nocardioides sp. LML1-1-1.1]|uniref:hypothetical protein n=1 Tax=Nocardioides sp. LML1-1-1.1 TaxID=3135248 RepID=UPI0034167B96
MTAPDSADRWKYGITAVIAGVLAIVVVFGIALWKFEKASDIGLVLGAVVSPIATIVAAYFGVQAGSAGKEAAEENARKNVAVGAGLATATTSDEVGAALRNIL